MGNPAVGYNNLYRNAAAAVTASSADASYPKELAYDWFLADYFKTGGSGTQYLRADMGSAMAVDWGGIGRGHNLASLGATAKLQYSNDNFAADINTALTITPTDDSSIFRTFTAISARHWQWEITAGAGAYILPQLAFGPRLDIPLAPNPGFAPPQFANNDEITNLKNMNGADIARYIEYKGGQIKQGFTLLTASWVRANWGAFRDHARKYAFFYAWNPDDFNAEVAYCRTRGKVPWPMYMKSYPTFMQVSLDLEAWVE